VIGGFAVTDAHVHIQPWEMHPSPVNAAMEAGRDDLESIRSFIESPAAFLRFLDTCGIERAAIINYVSPDARFRGQLDGKHDAIEQCEQAGNQRHAHLPKSMRHRVDLQHHAGFSSWKAGHRPRGSGRFRGPSSGEIRSCCACCATQPWPLLLSSHCPPPDLPLLRQPPAPNSYSRR